MRGKGTVFEGSEYFRDGPNKYYIYIVKEVEPNALVLENLKSHWGRFVLPLKDWPDLVAAVEELKLDIKRMPKPKKWWQFW